MRRFLVMLIAAGTAIMGAQAYAHHSFAATYLEDQTVTIEGEMVQFLFRNPHSFVHIMVKENDGTMARLYRRVGRHRAARRAGHHQRDAQAGRRGRGQWQSGPESNRQESTPGYTAPAEGRLRLGQAPGRGGRLGT